MKHALFICAVLGSLVVSEMAAAEVQLPSFPPDSHAPLFSSSNSERVEAERVPEKGVLGASGRLELSLLPTEQLAVDCFPWPGAHAANRSRQRQHAHPHVIETGRWEPLPDEPYGE